MSTLRASIAISGEPVCIPSASFDGKNNSLVVPCRTPWSVRLAVMSLCDWTSWFCSIHDQILVAVAGCSARESVCFRPMTFIQTGSNRIPSDVLRRSPCMGEVEFVFYTVIISGSKDSVWAQRRLSTVLRRRWAHAPLTSSQSCMTTVQH